MAGVECCSNPPVPDSAAGQGTVVGDIAGIRAYTAGSPDSKRAILFISDIHGFEAPNLRKIADKVSAAGFYVAVPDLFHGDAFRAEKHVLPTWLQSHKPDIGFEDVKLLLAALKNKGMLAIGAVGFCWGAKVVVQLAKFDYIKAAALCHPSFITVDDIKEVKTHIAVFGAEVDNYSPPELVKQFKEVLSVKSEVDSFVKIYPGSKHGWTTRFDADDEKEVKNAEEAHRDLLDWFLKHVKDDDA